jgi:hypothetical protein
MDNMSRTTRPAALPRAARTWRASGRVRATKGRDFRTPEDDCPNARQRKLKPGQNGATRADILLFVAACSLLRRD